MKLAKNMARCFTLGIAMLSISCDSNDSEDDAPTTTAEALETLQDGDSIFFTRTGGVASISRLDFDASGTSAIGDGAAFYAYGKTGAQRFVVSLSGDFNPETRFPQIIANLLNAGLGTEFRQLISFRNEPDFTTAELTRLISILNTAGADVSFASDGSLISRSAREYTCVVSSTEQDQILGTMGGIYKLDVRARRIGFRFPSNAELNEFRLLRPDSQIPYVLDEEIDVENIEVGSWILELSS
ncbi:MAG: hypothetical protein AB8F34_15410 [Akkermansiaceae bacterium]